MKQGSCGERGDMQNECEIDGLLCCSALVAGLEIDMFLPPFPRLFTEEKCRALHYKRPSSTT